MAAEGEAASLQEQLDVSQAAGSAAGSADDDSATAERVSELESKLKTAEAAHAAAVAGTEAAQQESQDAVTFMEEDLAALREELDSEKAARAELLAV